MEGHGKVCSPEYELSVVNWGDLSSACSLRFFLVSLCLGVRMLLSRGTEGAPLVRI